jgi:hypothetical protein
MLPPMNCPSAIKFMSAVALTFFVACSDEDGTPMDPVPVLDGASGESEAGVVDAAAPDVLQMVVMPDLGAPDARVTADADLPDAAPLARNTIFATFNGVLVRIDPDTAKLTVVGTLSNPAVPAQTFSDVSMHWSGEGNTAMTVLGFMSPRLATVDLCTAKVVPGPTMSRAATPNLVVEGIARHPNGTWYVSSGNAVSTLTPNLSTLNPTTGVITSLGGSVVTLQNDQDLLFFKDDVLWSFDVDTNANQTELFTLNLATGIDTNVVTVTQNDETLRVAYDGSRGKAFGWRVGDRNLLEVNLSTGAATALGETHPANMFASATIRAFFIAPSVVCPQ